MDHTCTQPNLTAVRKAIAEINAGFGVRAVFPHSGPGVQDGDSGQAEALLDRLMEKNRGVLKRLKESE